MSSCGEVSWAIAIGILTTVVSFLGGRYLRNRDSNRKEDHELINEITKSINDIEEKSYRYYSSVLKDNEAKQLSSELRILLRRVARDTQRFSNMYSNITVGFFVKNLRQAVTLHGLDDSMREAHEPTSLIFDEISKHCRYIIGELTIIFNKKYR